MNERQQAEHALRLLPFTNEAKEPFVESVELEFAKTGKKLEHYSALRELLREAVILFESDDECSDPSTAAWGWLQDARTALESTVVE